MVVLTVFANLLAKGLPREFTRSGRSVPRILTLSQSVLKQSCAEND